MSGGVPADVCLGTGCSSARDSIAAALGKAGS